MSNNQPLSRLDSPAHCPPPPPPPPPPRCSRLMLQEAPDPPTVSQPRWSSPWTPTLT